MIFVFLIGVISFIVYFLYNGDHSSPGSMTGLEVIGVISLVYLGCHLTLQACKCINTYCIKGSRRKNALVKERGRWALVTGATDGIGKAYAHELAKMGHKIILVSRNPKKLSDCAAEITEKHRVETKIIAVDFTEDTDIYDRIKTFIQGMEIGVLVNNVGIGYAYPELFLDIPDRENLVPALIKGNVVAITKMCELIMPQMVQRKSGVVINISSLSCLIPGPYLTLYAATKAFVENFSDNLRYEYENQGLVIQTVLPGYVATNMSKIRKTTWIAPSATKYVQSALSKVGKNDNTTGYFAHTLMVKFMNFLMYVCRPYAVSMVANNLKGVRARSLKKQPRQVQES